MKSYYKCDLQGSSKRMVYMTYFDSELRMLFDRMLGSTTQGGVEQSSSCV